VSNHPLKNAANAKLYKSNITISNEILTLQSYHRWY